jgi:chemotaxis protein CheX
MNLQELIVDSIRRSTAEVFTTMLAVDLGEGLFSVENGSPAFNDGVVSFIGVAGLWAGTGSISCSPALACRLCSLMLMADSIAVDEEVLDAVGELTNMVIGGVKTELETHLGPLGLSVPTVVFGRNFKAKSAGTTDWNVVRFQWEGETLLVKLCLAPTEKTGHPSLHPAGSSCALEV